ncbi:MAG: Gldg family protein [Deltaproteobacteria bacterium]
MNLICHYVLPAQIDLTYRGTYALAPQTRNLLASLRAPLDVTVLAPQVPRSVGEHNFRNAAVMFLELLDTCRRIQPLVRVQKLDPQESAAARQLQQEFPDITVPCVVLAFGAADGRSHEVLSARDLAEFRGGADRRLTAVEFLGEQALAGALARLTAGRKQAILYVTTGHGELALDDADPESRRGLGVLASRLRELDCELRPLDLTAGPRVPHDASVVVVAGGELPWHEGEAVKLGTYLRQGGKALLLADLNYDPLRRRPVPFGLEDLLSEFGVAVGNDRVITRGFTGQVEVASPALPAAGEQALVRSLPQAPVTLFECRSLSSSTGLRQLSTRVVPLLVSHPAPRAWAEGDFGTEVFPEPGGENDSDGPVAMAVAVERGQQGPAQPALVVVGDAEFVANRVLSEPAGRVNLSFALACLNWLRGRRELLGDIPPQRHEGYRLTGTPDEQRGIVWKSSLVLCSLIVTAGATVWTSRRRG